MRLLVTLYRVWRLALKVITEQRRLDAEFADLKQRLAEVEEQFVTVKEQKALAKLFTHAIPSDQPVPVALTAAQDREADRLIDELCTDAQSEPLVVMSFAKLKQHKLPIYLDYFRRGIEPRPAVVNVEAVAKAGWPIPDTAAADDKGVWLNLWFNANTVERCVENAALLLKAANDPGAVAKAAGFKSLGECVVWSFTLPHSCRLDR